MSISVAAVNDAPVAVNDPTSSLKTKFRVKEGSATPLVLTRADLVDANDYDIDNPTSDLVISGFTQPAGGTVAQKSGGLSYTPGSGFSGVDRFTYKVSDPGNASSNWAAVEISVAPIFRIVNCPTDSTDQGDNSDGTVDRKDCLIDWLGDGSFLTSFNDEPDIKGRIELDGVYDIEDPRLHCGGTPPVPDAQIEDSINGVTLRQTWGAASGVPASAQLPGLEVTPIDVDSGIVRIPWYICGMPNLENGGKPVFRLINAKSDFLAESATQDTDFRDIVNSVVEHEVDTNGPTNPAYECLPDVTTNVDPLIGWLPRNDEIPYVVGDVYAREGQVRDVTTGCASVRGGALTRSYLLKDLIYFDGSADPGRYGTGVTGTDNPGFRAIVRAELDDLEQTLLQPGRAFAEDGTRSSCVVADQNIISNVWPQPGNLTGGSLLIEKIRSSFDAGDYTGVLSRLDWLLTELRQATTANNKGGGLWSAFDTCYFKDDKIWNLPEYAVLDSCSVDSSTGVETCPDYPDPGSGYIPRNFRGDLEAQVLHLQWHIRHKLLGQPVEKLPSIIPEAPG